MPKNEAFLYLREHAGTPEFWSALLAGMKATGSAYWYAVSSLSGQGGLVPNWRVHVLTGAPQQRKRQVGTETVIAQLEKIGAIETVAVPGVGRSTQLNAELGRAPTTKQHLKALLVGESILREATREWARKNGLGSYNKVALSGGEQRPEFASFYWDLVAPSFIAPLASFTAGGAKAGFFVADISMARDLSSDHVQYFLRKCSAIRAAGASRPFIAMLVADSFTDDGLRTAKAAGVWVTTPANLFGDDIGRGLRALIGLMERAASVSVAKPEAIEAVFNSLKRIEGSAMNLRGALFEMVVGHCVSTKEGGQIELGVDVETSIGRTDIDVLRTLTSTAVICYECKGYAPGTVVPIEEVEKWVTTTVPAVRSWLKDQPRIGSLPQRFEFWTSGEFSDEALLRLEKASTGTKKYELRWRDGNGILEYAKGIQSPHIRRVLNEHYLRHPLADM